MAHSSPLLKTYTQLPFDVSRGEGAYVYDDTGTRYLDLYGGHAVTILGHCHPAITEAITQQAGKLLFYSVAAPIEIRERAARELIQFVATELTRVFFCNSGAEANENALKLAIQKSGRSKIAGLKGGWHGRTLLCMAATDDPRWHASLPGWIGKVERLAPNDERDLQLITDETAAIIVEPIQSLAGVRVLETDYLKALRERCDHTGTFLIFDEVQTGGGRTGVPFVSGSSGVCPDMATSAKALANGVPIGALLVNDRVASLIKPGDLGSTFGGGPLAMAALLATLETLKTEVPLRRATLLEAHARKVLKAPIIKEIRGRGALLGLVLSKPAKPVYENLLRAKILTGLCDDPSVLRLFPPLVMPESAFDELQRILDEVGHTE